MAVFSSIERVWKKKFFDGITLVQYDQMIKKILVTLLKIYING